MHCSWQYFMFCFSTGSSPHREAVDRTHVHNLQNTINLSYPLGRLAVFVLEEILFSLFIKSQSVKQAGLRLKQGQTCLNMDLLSTLFPPAGDIWGQLIQTAEESCVKRNVFFCGGLWSADKSGKCGEE